MRALWACILFAASCGAAPTGEITLQFPLDRLGEGILHGAVFASGTCAALPNPVVFDEAIVRVSHSADFDSENKHPMSLTGIPAGDDRMVVAVIEQNGAQVCRACADGLRIDDGSSTPVTLTLSNCP